MEERRKYPRVNERCFVEIYPGSKSKTSESKDISLGGISFESDEPMEIGQTLTIFLTQIDVAQDLKLACVVRRCEKIGGQNYILAVEFVGTDEKKQKRLVEFINP